MHDSEQEETDIKPQASASMPGEYLPKPHSPGLDDDWDEWPDFDPDAAEDDRPWDVFHSDDAEGEPEPEHGDFLLQDDDQCA